MDENRENDKIENNSTSMSESDNTFEVKESFLERIKGMFTRPRLEAGNNVKTTNMSLSSWNIRAAFRKALESVSNSVSNMISKKEPEVKNQFATTVIGQDNNKQNPEIRQENVATQTVTRIIPKVKARAVQTAPKGIIDNAKTAEAVKDASKELGIEVVDIIVNDGNNSRETNLEDERE